MEAYKFRHLIWEFNALNDTGDYVNIAIDDVKKHAEAGTMSAFLVDRFRNNADFSIIEGADWIELNDEWQRFSGAIDEGRKFGVRNNALCLLLAYALQSFQDRMRE